MKTVMEKWWVLETTGQQMTTILPQHIHKNWNIVGGEKNEIEWSCDKWSGYKRLWFHSYFIILSIVSHHYGSSSQTTTCPDVNSVRWSAEYCSSPALASTSDSSAQEEAPVKMVRRCWDDRRLANLSILWWNCRLKIRPDFKTLSGANLLCFRRW